MKVIEGYKHKANNILIQILWFVSIYIVSYVLLFASMGIDFTDEGLYLLEAGGVNTNAVWGVPYGKVLRPIFCISGYDIGYYRALSFSILAFLHISIFKEVLRFNQNGIQDIKSSVIFGIIILLVSFLFFNGLFIRTPGYNYVNYLSIVLFVYGIVRLKNANLPEHYHNELIIVLSIAISTTAKPTTTIAMFLALAVLHFNRFVRFRIKSVNKYISLGILGVILITYAFYPAWIYLYKFIFINKEHEIVFLGSQKLSMDIIIPFISYFGALLSSDFYNIKFIYVLSGLVLLAYITKLLFQRISIHNFFFLALFITLILITFKKPSALSTMLNLIFWMFWIQHCFTHKNKFYLQLLILAIPFVYAFGTSNSYLMMATHTFPLIFSIHTAYHFGTIFSDKYVITIILGLPLFFYAVIVNNPYRTDKLSDCSIKIKELSHGTYIKIPKETGIQVNAMKAVLSRNGWLPGNEMLCINYRWSTTIPYMLGANTGAAAMTTIFGYEKSVNVGLAKIRRSGFTKRAWIMFNSRVLDTDENLNSTWRTKDSVRIARKSEAYFFERDSLLSVFFKMNNMNTSSYDKVFDDLGYTILKPKINK